MAAPFNFPQSGTYQPFTGMEGLPTGMFGNGPLGLGSQMLLQGYLAQTMGGMGMAPMGVSEQNLFDRLRQQRFTQQHNAFIREMAERDQINYLRTARGMAAMTGTPWGSSQQAAASSLASGIVAASPVLAQMFPDYLDEFSGNRGSSAVMAHYMHLGSKYRIDPVTGKMGMTNAAAQQLMSGVYDELFSGNRYQQTSLSAGRAGQLFQEMQLRGIMPGAASLEQLSRANPDRLRELFGTAGLEYQPLQGLNANDRDKLLSTPQVQQELRSFDAKKVSGALRDWGSAIEAMREIFGDAGYPNAPMPELLNALNQVTAGASSQLSAGRLAGIVRTTQSLADSSRMGMTAATAMTQQAAADATTLGLNPIFGSQIAQQSLAFLAAYQGMGAGSHQAWGRGNMMEHQAIAQQLTTNAIASQAANQMAAAYRINDLSQFADGSDAANFVTAVRNGETSFNTAAGRRSTDMLEHEFVAMVSSGTGGRMTPGQVRAMLAQSSANQEVLFNNPQMAAAVRRLQGAEFLANYSQTAGYTLRASVQDRLQGAYAGDMDGVLNSMGQAALSAFMNAGGDVVENAASRNQAMAGAMEQRLQSQAAAGDTGAKQLLAQLNAAPDRDSFLLTLANSVYHDVDQALLNSGQLGLQNAYTVHNPRLLRRQAHEQARAQVRAMTKEAMAPLAKGGMLRRAMEAVMAASPDSKDPLLQVFGAAFGGARGKDIAAAIGAGRLGELQSLYNQMEQAEDAFANAATPEAQAKAFSVAEIRANAFREEMFQVRQHLEEQGLLYDAKIGPQDSGRVIRHLGYLQKRLAGGEATRSDVTSHAKNIEDLLSSYMGDDNTVLRLGKAGLSQWERLRATQDQLYKLSADKFNGDLTKTVGSAEGRKLLAQQQALTAGLHNMLEDPAKHYSYLGAAEKTELQGLANRLAADKQLNSATLESLLGLSDEELQNKKLTAAEQTLVRQARDSREAVRDTYFKLSAKHSPDAAALLKGSLETLLAGTVDDPDQTQAGRDVLRVLSGGGLAARELQAFVAEEVEDKKHYANEIEALTAFQRKALELESRDNGKAEAKSDGPQKIEVAHLHIHGGGRATIELLDDNAEGP